MAEILSTAIEDHILHSTTTTYSILPDKQHCITKTITSLVHTDISSIRQSILSNLPVLMDQSNPKSNPTSVDDTSMSTATFSFSSFLTVDKSTTGKPVKKLYSFAIQLDQVSSNELCNSLCAELVFVTIPSSSSSSSVTPPSSSTTTTMLTTPAHIRGTITLAPQTPGTTTVTLTVSMEVTQEAKSPKSGMTDSGSGFTIASSARKNMNAGPKTVLPRGNHTPSSSLSPTAPSPKTAAVILSHVTNVVLSLHTRYAHYEQVDAAMYKKFEEEEVPNAPPIQSHEDDLVNKSLVFADDSKSEAKFKRIKVSEGEAHSEPAIHDATLLVQQHELVLVPHKLLSHSLRSLVQGTVLEPVEFYQKVEGNAGAWGKAVATVDASAARVFADRWCQNSHEHKKKHAEKEGPDTLNEVFHVPNTHSMLLVNLLRLPNPVSNRVFAIWVTWRKEPDNTFLMAFGPMEDFADQQEDGNHAFATFVAKQEKRRKREGKAEDLTTVLKDNEELKLMMQQRASKKEHVQGLNDLIERDPLASKAIRGTVRGYWRIKPITPSVCQVTYLVQAELGGSMPTALLTARIKGTLGVVQTMQVKFARNGKLVDKEIRDAFSSPPVLADLSEEQMSLVEGCRSLESEDGSEWEILTSPSPFVEMWLKHAPAKKNERLVAIGKAAAVIDCSVHEAAGESSEASASRAAR